MHADVLIAEIGSTTTVLSAFDGLAEGSVRPLRLLGQERLKIRPEVHE